MLFAGRISEAAMGGGEARSAPFCVFLRLKRLVRTVHARQKPLMLKYFFFRITDLVEKLTVNKKAPPSFLDATCAPDPDTKFFLCESSLDTKSVKTLF